MKFLLLIQIITLISLSTQLHHHGVPIDAEISFPIKAVAVIRGETKDPVSNELFKINGIVHFTQESQLSKVTVSIDIKGLPKHNSETIVKRGFHIHSFAISDYSDNITAVCGSTGPHFNPTNKTHGDLNSDIRHNGDLGNLITLPDGSISMNIIDDRLSLFGENSIIGRSLVLHGGEDDLGLKNTDSSRSSGSSGPRIACGVIGLEKSEAKAVSRSLFDFISGGKILSNVQYLSLDEPFINNTSSNDSSVLSDSEDDDEIETIEEISKIFPQAIPVFKLFYKILANVVESTRESNMQLMQALSQLQLAPPVLEINATIPIDFMSIDNSTNSDSKLNY